MSASIAVDYSGSAAYLACVRGREILAQEEIQMHDSPYTFFHHIQLKLTVWNATYKAFSEFWIEDQVPAGRNIIAGLKLVRVKTILELAGLEVGLEPCFAHPGTWRKRVLGNGRPDDPKERARQAAKEFFGFETKFKNQHNICEAMLIAFYGYLQHHPEELTLQEPSVGLARRVHSAQPSTRQPRSSISYPQSRDGDPPAFSMDLHRPE